MRLRKLLLATAAMFGISTATRAQAVRGIVVDAVDRPVFGVVVLLVDSTSRVNARGLSTERGEFRLSAPRSGTYRIRTMRIGYRPALSDPFVVTASGDVTRRVVVTGLPVGLDTMRVADKGVCRAFTDSAAATFAVWEQIRTALTAAELTASSRAIIATTVAYEKAIDPRIGKDGKIVAQQASVATQYVTRPWLTLPPDSLRKAGYVVTARDNSVTYYAPGLDMLLSPGFVEDHCFRLTIDDKRPALVGISFEPTPDRRKKVPEVEGALWVDRASSELRDLEFGYVNVTSEQHDYARGALSFARLRDGTWAVSRWTIQMPVVENVIVPGQIPDARVTQVRLAGGILAVARKGSDTLWSGPTIALHGTVVDSASGHAIARAHVGIAGSTRDVPSDEDGRFTIANLQPGQYILEVRTASLDSVSARHRASVTVVDSTAHVELRVPSGRQLAAAVCGAKSSGDGIILGRLRIPDDTNPAATLANGKVVAEWRASASDSTHMRRAEVRAADDGQFRMCGVPLNAAIALRASSDSAETDAPLTVNLTPANRMQRVDVAMRLESELAKRGATFSGVVIADSTQQPIAGAEVSFPELGKTVLTDQRGEFRVLGIPAGPQHLSVRRIGYGAADATVAFAGHEIVDRRVVLGKAISLAPVVVTEHAIDRAMQSFDENRRVGLGHFVTRVELEKFTGMRLTNVLSQMPGMGLVQGNLHIFAYGSRTPPPICNPRDRMCLESHGFYVGDGTFSDAPIACYALVYVDGVLQNGAREPTEPVDLSEYPPERVEAVEFYASAAETPVQYSRMGSGCGVLVIWTRRSP